MCSDADCLVPTDPGHELKSLVIATKFRDGPVQGSCDQSVGMSWVVGPGRLSDVLSVTDNAIHSECEWKPSFRMAVLVHVGLNPVSVMDGSCRHLLFIVMTTDRRFLLTF